MASVAYVGHATVRLELDGVELLTDPLLRTRVAHLRRVAPLPAGAAVGIDAVLVSHAHYDHLDLPSLRLLPASTLLVAPRGTGRLLKRFERVVELEEGGAHTIGPLVVRAMRAEHPGGRTPFDRRTSALSYVIRGTRNVYFAGDTGLFAAMEGLVPNLDVALLPIWGWGTRLGPGHLDPGSAAEALRLLRPRTAVPIHWGTYGPLHRARRVDGAALDEPAKAFARAAAELAPNVDVRILRPGEVTSF